MQTRKDTAYLIASLILLLGVSFTACKKEGGRPIEPIKIGKEAESLTKITLNRNSKKILLQGGDGKYRATVADSKIASVEVVKDSLVVKGLLEGKTFATIISHDVSQRLDIEVVFPSLSFSQNSIKLYPDPLREERSVKLSGGGLTPTIKAEPEGIVDLKWDGSKEELVITALRVGDAVITAKDNDDKEATLEVTIRPDDQPEKFGIYGTNGRYLSQSARLSAVLVSQQPDGKIIMANGASPKGGELSTQFPTTVVQLEVVKSGESATPKAAKEAKEMANADATIKVTHITDNNKVIKADEYPCRIIEIEGGKHYYLHKDFIFYLPTKK